MGEMVAQHLFQPPFSVPLCRAGCARLKLHFPDSLQLSNFSSTNQIQSRETNSHLS